MTNFKYSEKSERLLSTAHPKLRIVFREVLPIFDHTIVSGYRGKEEQNKYVKDKKSKLPFPKSMHNHQPSLAVDAVPYPSGYDNIPLMHTFASLVMAIGIMKGIRITWGGRWEDPNDLAHFELVI